MAFLLLVLAILVRQFDRTHGLYSCTLNSLDLTCTGFIENIPEPLVAGINKTFITSFSVTNAKLPSISRATFQEFSNNLQTVYLTSSGIVNVESDAFSSNGDLQYLSLRDNELSHLNVECPALQELDLSFNLIDDLSRFNISAHPRLRVLNVSYNRLTYLPLEVLAKLEQKNDFFLIIDNNPWDCLHPQWTDYLGPRLINVFCTDHSYIASYKLTEREVERKIGRKPYCDENLICLKCSYSFCLVWLFGGIWIGVILGNLIRIKRLICGKYPMYSDKYTQSEYTLVDQHMISAVFDYKTRKLIPISTMGTIASNHSGNLRTSDPMPFFSKAELPGSTVEDNDDEDDEHSEKKNEMFLYKSPNLNRIIGNQ